MSEARESLDSSGSSSDPSSEQIKVLRQIVCARKEDGTYRIEHKGTAEILPRLSVSRDGLPAGDSSSSLHQDVVLVPASSALFRPEPGTQPSLERNRCLKVGVHRQWARALVAQNCDGDRTVVNIDWARLHKPTRTFGLSHTSKPFTPGPNSLPVSRWTLLHPDKSAYGIFKCPGSASGFCAVSLQARILQTAKTLFIGLEPSSEETLKQRQADASFWHELVLRIASKTDIVPETLHENVLKAVYYTILNDEHLILSQMDASLCIIDEELHEDHNVRCNIAYWRRLVGSWRSYLHGRSTFSAQLSLILPYYGKSDYAAFEKDPIDGIQDVPTIEYLHNSLPGRNHATIAHCEATFTALMTTMSIMESEKAIQEAESVTRLTNFAFFFLPITVAAGIFGMNIKEFADSAPSVWMFVLTCIVVLSGTYFVLYGWFQRMSAVLGGFFRRKMLEPARLILRRFSNTVNERLGRMPDYVRAIRRITEEPNEPQEIDFANLDAIDGDRLPWIELSGA